MRSCRLEGELYREAGKASMFRLMFREQPESMRTNR